MIVTISQSTFASLWSTEPTIDPGYKFGDPLDTTMNPRLAVDVVILDSVEEPRQTPERVGFQSI